MSKQKLKDSEITFVGVGINYYDIYRDLIDAMRIMYNRIESIEWWSNRGRIGPRGMPEHEPNKEDCLRMVGCVEDELKKLKHYINTGDEGVEEEYRSIMKYLNETGGVM